MTRAGLQTTSESGSHEFGFPFQPYGVQLEFARQMLQALQDRKVGVFESPTGTGKSMSIICSALQWLKLSMETDPRPSAQPGDEDEADWVLEHFQRSETEAAERLRQRLFEKTVKRRRRIEQEASRSSLKSFEATKRPRNILHIPTTSDDFLLEDYDSDEERLGKDLHKAVLSYRYDFAAYLQRHHIEDLSIAFAAWRSTRGGSLSTSTAINPGGSGSDSDESELTECLPRVIYCSRTQSQLSQFVGELRRVIGAAGEIKVNPTAGDGGTISFAVTVVPFASRKHTCINPGVNIAPSVAAVNDRCLDLRQKRPTKRRKKSTTKDVQQEESAPDAGCAYFQDSLIRGLRDRILNSVLDIEEIASMGKERSTCPYYSMRAAMKSNAQFLILPYHALLDTATRASLGIVLDRNCAVIFDEAHNVIDAVNELNSALISTPSISVVSQAIESYHERYCERLHPKNLFYIRQFTAVLNNLAQFAKQFREANEQSRRFVANEFLFAVKLDNINLFKLLEFENATRLTYKLHGFLIANDNDRGIVSNRSDIYAVMRFIRSLTTSSADGRVFVTADEDARVTFKFLLLDPSVTMIPLVEAAGSTIFAGGTLSPRTDLELRLLKGLAPERLVHFSCGHVVPTSSVLCTLLETGPSGRSFDFRHQSRQSPELVAELGITVVNLIKVVPNGVILFFPSYAYERYVYEQWNRLGFIERIAQSKKIFREESRKSVDLLLRNYADAAQESGAILFSVVGGKLAEGINFKDSLGRALLVVGLPYPNPNDLETKEIVRHLEVSADPSQANEFLEDICMKQVNQSIGRCIRDRYDFASIVLIDQRYRNQRIKGKLASWVRASAEPRTFGVAMQANVRFFRERA